MIQPPVFLSGEKGNRHKNKRNSAKNSNPNQEMLIIHIGSLHNVTNLLYQSWGKSQ